MTAAQTKRGRGRPAIGQVVELRLAPEALTKIDKLAAKHKLPRAEVIRALVGIGLEHSPRKLAGF